MHLKCTIEKINKRIKGFMLNYSIIPDSFDNRVASMVSTGGKPIGNY